MVENEPVLGNYGRYVEVTDISEISEATKFHKAIIDDADSKYSELNHTHTKSDITDFSHTHTQSDITAFEWVDKTDELNSAIQEYCTFEVNEDLRLAQLQYNRGDLRLGTGTTISNVGVPVDYLTIYHVRTVFSNNIYMILFGAGSTEEGNIGFGNGSGSATTPTINFQIMWHY